MNVDNLDKYRIPCDEMDRHGERYQSLYKNLKMKVMGRDGCFGNENQYTRNQVLVTCP